MYAHCVSQDRLLALSQQLSSSLYGLFQVLPLSQDAYIVMVEVYSLISIL